MKEALAWLRRLCIEDMDTWDAWLALVKFDMCFEGLEGICEFYGAKKKMKKDKKKKS